MTQELPPSARTIQPSSGKVLAGLAFLFCLPSLGVSLLFYILMGTQYSLLIPSFGINPGEAESRGALAFLLNLLPVVAFGGLLASLDLIRNYWKERLPSLNGWSKEKALWLTLPFFVLGPLYYHLVILTAALKAPGRKTALWSLAGILGASVQCIAIWWGFIGEFSLAFAPGLFIALAGVVTLIAAIVTLLQLADEPPSTGAIVLAAFFLLCAFTSQVFHCAAVIRAENAGYEAGQAFAKAVGKPLEELQPKNLYLPNQDTETDGPMAKRLQALLENRLEDVPVLPVALLRPTDEQGNRLPYGQWPADYLQEFHQWLQRIQKDIQELDTLMEGPAGKPICPEQWTGHNWPVVALCLRWHAIVEVRLEDAIQGKDSSGVFRSLQQFAWLRDTIAAVPDWNGFRIAIQIERHRQGAISEALSRKLLNINQLNKISAFSPEWFLRQARQALVGSTAAYLEEMETYLKPPKTYLWDPKSPTMGLPNIAFWGRWSRFLPGIQALGGIVYNPQYWIVQKSRAFVLEAATLSLPELPLYLLPTPSADANTPSRLHANTYAPCHLLAMGYIPIYQPDPVLLGILSARQPLSVIQMHSQPASTEEAENPPQQEGGNL